MVSQNNTSTTKEKETEKAKEKVLKLMGFPNFTMLHGNDQAAVALEIMTRTAKSSLIPRVVDTNIMVYPIRTIFNADMSMFESQSERDCITNSQHVINAEAAARRGSTARAGPNCRDSPLYLAVLRNDLDLVKRMLCKKDTKNNALFNKEGNSTVRAAITNKNQEMLDTILKAQPDLVYSTDEEGLTPLSYAAYNGCPSIVWYILKKFPDTRSIRNKDKSYPIHKACLGGHVEVLQVFYSQFPKLFLSDVHHGRTVLHLAAKERNNKLKHVVSYLLSLKEGGELIKKKDENGYKPLDLATKYNNLEVERLIKSCMRQ